MIAKLSQSKKSAKKKALTPLTDNSKINLEDSGLEHDWLRRLSEHPIESAVISLAERIDELEPIVRCDSQGNWWTGPYIGTIQFEGLTLRLNPRYGFEFISECLAEAMELAIVPSLGSLIDEEVFIPRLLAMLWINSFANAAKHGLPFLRRKRQHTGMFIKGRLLVKETLRRRVGGLLTAASETYERDLDNPIGRTIVCAYRTLHRQLGHNKTSTNQWIQGRAKDLLPTLQGACGINPKLPSEREIQNIRYTPITMRYRPFVSLSHRIAKGQGLMNSVGDNENKGVLINVAELWELFVFHTAKSALNDLSIIHGTRDELNRYYLLEDTAEENEQSPLGKLLPDIRIEEKAIPIAIADAKYKVLNRRWLREDLYQLNAYISRFNVPGALVYPLPKEAGEDDSLTETTWSLATNEKNYNVRFIHLPLSREQAREKWKEIANVWLRKNENNEQQPF